MALSVTARPYTRCASSPRGGAKGAGRQSLAAGRSGRIASRGRLYGLPGLAPGGQTPVYTKKQWLQRLLQPLFLMIFGNYL